MYFVEKSKELNFFKRFDYISFLIVVAISLIGILVFKSAISSYGASRKMFMVQAGSLGVGVVLTIIISLLDYKDFKTLGFIFYGFTIVLLVMVLAIGSGDELGSRSWLSLMGFKFQPSEFAKISTVLVTSIFLERIYEDQKSKKASIIKFIFYAGVPISLILLQKDFGTTIVFLFMLFVMVFMCGLKYKYVFIMGGTFLASLPVVWFFFLNDARRSRIWVFLNPERDPQGYGYNVYRAKMAIGSGQIFGKGLFKGPQTQYSMVPVKESDFIFSVAGEELGFIGATIILLLVAAFLLRCLFIAKGSRDPYGSFLVLGVASFMAVHFIINIGMNIGIVPVTGIPLPFISQGGSAMITNYIAFGVVLSVSARRQKVIFN